MNKAQAAMKRVEDHWAQSANRSELSLQVDALGRLQAEYKVLEDRIKRLKAEVLATMAKEDLKRASGELFGVVRIEKDTKRVDWRTVAEKMNPPRQLVTAHTKMIHSEYVQVGIRKGE